MENKNSTGLPQQQEEQNILTAVKKHKKHLLISTIIVAVITAGIIVWYLIALDGARKADEAVALADTELNDSTALAYYMAASEMGHKSGNRTGLEVAVRLYQKGDYQQALTYLKKSSVKSGIIESGRLALMGDCYANLGELDQAIASYKKAVNAADNNPQICPFLLVKEANIYREQARFDEEYKTYQQIIHEYPTYVADLNQRRIDIRKYAERAKANAAND